MKCDYQSERIDKVIDYITDNPENNLSLKEIAGIAMFSEFHFHRLFKKATGETPRQYIKRLKMERARKILEVNNDIELKDLWCKLGYCTASHFCKDFRLYFGCTPLQYKKQNHSKNNYSDNQASIKEQL